MKFGMTIAAGAMALASAAFGQQGVTRVSVHTDWSVFTASSAGSGFADCWSAAEPRSVVNTRGGQTVDVRRGDIQLMIAFTKGSSNAHIAFTGGYPYGDGSTVTANVDGKEFTFLTQNQPDANGEATGWAWPRAAADEGRIVDAMKRGAEATMSGRSSRGTTTKDTFSLSGFTAAFEAAQRACSS